MLREEARELAKQERLPEAIAKLQRALEITSRSLGENDERVAKCLITLADYYGWAGQYERAEPLYTRALDILKRLSKVDRPSPLYMQTLNDLARLYLHVPAFGKAASVMGQAMSITLRELDATGHGDYYPEYLDSISDLAQLYLMSADWFITPQEKDSRNRLLTIGEEMLLAVAKVHHKTKPNSRELAHTLNTLGDAYEKMGITDRAETHYLEASTIMKNVEGENSPTYATSLTGLAGFYFTAGQHEKAKAIQAQVLEIEKRSLGPRDAEYGFHLELFALICHAAGQPNEALATLNASMAVQQDNMTTVFRYSSESAMRAYFDNRLGLSTALEVLITICSSFMMDDVADRSALTWAFRRKGLIQESICRLRELQRLSERESSIALRSADLRAARQRLTDIQLTSTKGQGSTMRQSEIAALREQCDRIETELHRVVSDRFSAQDVQEVTVASVQRHVSIGSVLVDIVRSRIYDFKAKSTATRWRPAHYFAFVLATGKAPVRMIDLGDAAEIDRSVQRLRDSMTQASRELGSATPDRIRAEEKNHEDEFRAASAQLHRLVFVPLRGTLGGATTIYVSPDGELNRVPFESLVDSKGKYLIESYRFAYLTTGRDLLRKPAPPGKGTVVFASPDFDLGMPQREQNAKTLLTALPNAAGDSLRGNTSRDLRGLKWDRLDGAEQEAADIARELGVGKFGPVKLFTGKDALEEVFKAIRSPRILHVATHGYFLPDQQTPPADRFAPMEMGTEFGAARGLTRLRAVENPMLRSGLVLAGANTLGQVEIDPLKPETVDDGWLTAEEIAMMDLRGTELVVLSACESGLGDIKCGEGVMGLRRAFQLAGARTLLTSLFKIPDTQTREMMRTFYRGLKQGKGKLNALHDAQLEIIRQRRAKNKAAHPFFWASFVLVGDPN